MTDERPLRRRLRRFTAGTTTAGLVLLGAPMALPDAVAPEPADPAPGDATAAPTLRSAPPLELVGHRKRHPHRTIKKYRVKRGDTATGIAVRYHAWTAQLLRINHTDTLYAGQVILVPVVTKASRACDRHRHHRTGFGTKRTSHRKAGAHQHRHKGGQRDGHRAKPSKKRGAPTARQRPPRQAVMTPGRAHARGHDKGWYHDGASREQIRRLVVRRAHQHDVNPNLALAIAWQESGWQHRRVSSAGALGAMQIMPGTGQWMSMVVGRKLNPRDLFDNVTAGVVLIRLLRDQAGRKTAVAGYYQGLAGVRRHGMYPSTKRYVKNVIALQQRIAGGWNPA